MSEIKENSDLDESSSSSPKISFAMRLVGLATKFFEGVVWFTEKVIGLLRLLAISTLFLVVLFVVFRAVQSSDVIVVKPVSVPKSMSDKHAQAGRIISNILKQDLKEEEQNYVASIKGLLGGQISSIADDQQLSSGADITIPQTGISINDVVEFISSIFGKQSIAGSVYEDEKAIYLQLELKGRILSFETPLVQGKSRLKLLEEMLHKSSTKKILSVAFENYNLYYYCNREVDVIEQHRGKYKKWFDYCKQSRELDSEEKIIALKNVIESYGQNDIDKEDRLAVHTLTQISRVVDNKFQLIQKAKAEAIAKNQQADQGGQANNVVAAAAATSKAEKEARAKAAVKSLKQYQAHSVKRAAEVARATASAVTSKSMAMAVPAPATAVKLEPLSTKMETVQAIDPLVMELKKNCQNPANLNESNRKEADGVLLYKLQLYADAIKKYKDAIRSGCNNARAWANLGVLYTMAEDEKYQDAGKAIAVLAEATRLNKEVGWIQHSLCIAEAYAVGMKDGDIEALTEKAMSSESCQQARTLEPANAVLYDKLFYLALADRFNQEKQTENAFALYKKSLQVDKRADCHMFNVITKLNSFEDKKADAELASCEVLKEAYFIESKGLESESVVCLNDLKLLRSKCKN